MPVTAELGTAQPSEFEKLWSGLNPQPEGVLIFPPQGDFKAGVGKFEYETSQAFRAFIDRSDRIIGGDVPFSQKMFEDPLNDLSDPPNAQLGLTVICLALLEMAKEKGIITHRPEKIVSLSGSELAAAFAAGEIETLEDTFRAATVRGQLTKEASIGHDVLMTTLIALKPESDILANAQGLVELYKDEAEKIADDGTVDVSGINSPVSIGLTGDRHMVESVKVGLEDITRKANDMDMIKIGSHSKKIMSKVSGRYREILKHLIKDPKIPVNMNGIDIVRSNEALERFEKGLEEPVDFVSVVKSITSDGKNPKFYELSTKQIDPVKGEKTTAWGRFANDTLKPSGIQLEVVVI